jgi:hypothetical protein
MMNIITAGKSNYFSNWLSIKNTKNTIRLIFREKLLVRSNNSFTMESLILAQDER